MGEDFWESVKQQWGICQMWCQSHPSLPSPAPAGGAPSNPRAPTSLLSSPLFPLPRCFGESSSCPLPLPCFVPSRECKAWAQPGPVKDALRGGPAAIFRKATQGSPELRKACSLPQLWPCCQDTLLHLPCSFQKAQSWSWPEGVGPWGSIRPRAAPYLQIPPPARLMPLGFTAKLNLWSQSCETPAYGSVCLSAALQHRGHY